MRGGRAASPGGRPRSPHRARGKAATSRCAVTSWQSCSGKPGVLRGACRKGLDRPERSGRALVERSTGHVRASRPAGEQRFWRSTQRAVLRSVGRGEGRGEQTRDSLGMGRPRSKDPSLRLRPGRSPARGAAPQSCLSSRLSRKDRSTLLRVRRRCSKARLLACPRPVQPPEWVRASAEAAFPALSARFLVPRGGRRRRMGRDGAQLCRLLETCSQPRARAGVHGNPATSRAVERRPDPRCAPR
jgi:hypothetical protein